MPLEGGSCTPPHIIGLKFWLAQSLQRVHTGWPRWPSCECAPPQWKTHVYFALCVYSQHSMCRGSHPLPFLPRPRVSVSLFPPTPQTLYLCLSLYLRVRSLVLGLPLTPQHAQGSGKTTLAQQIAANTGRELISGKSFGLR